MRFLFPITCLLLPLTVACSSDDKAADVDQNAETGGSGGDGAGGSGAGGSGAVVEECDPNAEIPCIEGIAEPCDYETGWDGDEYCLAVPDETVGLQIHTGPTDYDNPDDYNRYVIEPGEETNWAEISETPNAEDVYIDGYYSFMRPGSHHFILFSLPEGTYQPGTQDTGGGAESAVGAVDGEFRAGATRAIQGAVLTADDPNVQAGSLMEAKGDIAMNLHFINTTNEPLLQEVWVNFHLIDRDLIRRWLRPITWFGGLSMSIPPGAVETLTNAPSACLPPVAPESEIAVMTGHVHANTVRYNATRVRDGAEEILFEDYDWHEPTQFMFLPGYDYPAPDPENATAGVSQSGILAVQPGDQYFWECEVHNERDITLTFGNKVYDAEMCMVFGFYSSSSDTSGNWFCAF